MVSLAAGRGSFPNVLVRDGDVSFGISHGRLFDRSHRIQRIKTDHCAWGGTCGAANCFSAREVMHGIDTLRKVSPAAGGAG
jgi:hypothetical protein